MKLHIREDIDNLYAVIFEAADGFDYDARTELYKVRDVLLSSGYSIVNEISDRNRIVVKDVDEEEYKNLKYIYKELESEYIHDYDDYTDFSFSETEYPVAFRRVTNYD